MKLIKISEKEVNEFQATEVIELPKTEQLQEPQEIAKTSAYRAKTTNTTECT